MPVVAPLELDDLLAPGKAARHANRRHRRLGAARDQAHHLETGEQAHQQLGHLHLEPRRRAEAGGAVGLAMYRLHYTLVPMPENERTPRPDVIDIVVAIGIDQMRTTRLIEEE